MKRLSSADREFFTLVPSGVCQSVQRSPRKSESAIGARDAGSPLRKRTGHRLANVADRVARLERDQATNLKAYQAEDQEILRNAFLFEVFHRYLDPFDRLIQEQLVAGESPCPVSLQTRR